MACFQELFQAERVWSAEDLKLLVLVRLVQSTTDLKTRLPFCLCLCFQSALCCTDCLICVSVFNMCIVLTEREANRKQIQSTGAIPRHILLMQLSVSSDPMREF